MLSTPFILERHWYIIEPVQLIVGTTQRYCFLIVILFMFQVCSHCTKCVVAMFQVCSNCVPAWN